MQRQSMSFEITPLCSLIQPQCVARDARRDYSDPVPVGLDTLSGVVGTRNATTANAGAAIAEGCFCECANIGCARMRVAQAYTRAVLGAARPCSFVVVPMALSSGVAISGISICNAPPHCRRARCQALIRSEADRPIAQEHEPMQSTGDGVCQSPGNLLGTYPKDL